jgi:gliding motility-associated lipoprotein GldJ
MRVFTYLIFLIITFFLITFFSGCAKKESYSKKSRGTGWNMIGAKRGFVNSTDAKNGPAAGPGLIFIEGGTFTFGKVQDDVMKDWNNMPTQQHVMSFYMDETEVTNFMYAEYLEWLKHVFTPENKSYVAIYAGALPDTLVWRNRLGYNETMTNNYLRHPAYANYPVVGVNWIQATEFCKWRTDRVNEARLEKEGYLKKDSKTQDVSAENSFSTETYLNVPKLMYGGNEEIVLKVGGIYADSKKKKGTDAAESDKEEKNVYAQRSSGILLPEYRLPTEAEWEYAAAADVGQREYNNYKGQKKYPWSGSSTYSKKRNSRGDQLANFKQGNGDYGGIAGWSNDKADITNKVKSYPPNDFGLYDMAGNVSEWVADVYRPMIDNEINDFNYFRGNIYTKNKIGKDGKAELVTFANMVYDTLANGKIIARNLPGQLMQVPVDSNDTFLRQNFDKAYEVNYRDGDKQSLSSYKKSVINTKDTKINNRMYNSPENSAMVDSMGNITRKLDKLNTRKTLINDKMRVYKGGSWRDRAYWLDPAQRKGLSQEVATDYLGFRCAMSKVGSKMVQNRSSRN